MLNSQLINDYIKHLEELRKDSRERLHQSAVRWDEWSNNRSADLSKHLFTIASLILPLSVLPLTQTGFTDGINYYGKWIIVCSWLCFMLSLIFGLLHITLESKFFHNWANQENNRSSKFNESIFTTSPTDAFNRLERMNQESNRLIVMSESSNNKFLYLQQGFLIFGILLIGIILSIKLFTASAENKNKQAWNDAKPYNIIIEHHNAPISPTPSTASPSASF